jgi:peptidoglycan/LPS O-acetylase OafA/YrhL
MNSLLDRLLRREQNSLDFIRFTAASAVLFSHAWPISGGQEMDRFEPLKLLSRQQMNLGEAAVFVFFLISGFLVTASFERSKTWLDYVKARFLRIMPGLAVVLLLTAFVLGPLVSSLGPAEYFGSSQTYLYLKGLLLKDTSLPLPGVFEQNPWPGAVNGSLWTLFYEVSCYVMVFVLGMARLLRGPVVLGLLGLAGAFNLFMNYFKGTLDSTPLAIVGRLYGNYYIYHEIYFVMPFLVGMLFYLYRERVKFALPWTLLCALTLPIALGLGGLYVWFLFAGAYLIFQFGSWPKSPLQRFGVRGDFSYGIYIYAWPVQQLVVLLLGSSIAWYTNVLLAFPLTFLLAVLSWHLIEKPALNLKKSRKPAPMVESSAVGKVR